MEQNKKQEEKLHVRQAIVVEGRDDTAAVRQAVEAIIIETHGFGIRPQTWALLEKADRERGLIIFTDPDHAGEEIRRRVTARFPESGQAYLTREKARRKDDIGIENASPQDIRRAIEQVHYTKETTKPEFKEEDLAAAGLLGGAQATARRQAMGDALGIGYGNGKAFLRKLNQFAVSRQTFEAALKELEKGR